ncbi:MAG: trypsin-like peptidase domain-containing protein [Alphaproteobacteria bacterium]|nr:trypsin-like peptidase domain-containing protein [Alphaproteobacteria bacterium]
MIQRAFLLGLIGLAFGAVAFAQKPAPAPSPGAALPTEKPPPLPRQGAGAELPRDKPPPLAPGERAARRAVSSGTGFVVAASRIMTNHHVIDGCAEVAARLPNGQEIPTRVLASDATRDLALLSTEADAGPILPFRGAGSYRRGEGVVTYGFPLAGLLSSGPTLTTGEISALAGLADNPRHLQISAPVQPGNSGGPLLDMRGQVVGVVVSKLNAGQVARQTGDIPQNVNFAVKHTEALEFLREQNVTPTNGPAEQAPRAADAVGEIAHPSTLFLRCLK